MSITFLGLPNILSKTYCVFSTDGFAGLESVGLESLYLKTEEPSEIARLNTLDPAHTKWFFSLSGLRKDMSGFALVNHNLVPGDMVRFLGAERATYTRPPNAIVTSSNATGAVTNVDEEIDSPDGLVIGPTVNTNAWSVTFGWGAFLVPPKLGFAMGQLVVRVKLNFSGAGADNPVTYPKCTVTLKEGGSVKRVLGYRAVTSTAANGQILIFPFDFSELAVIIGTNIEFMVEFLEGTSQSGGSYATLDTVTIQHEDADVVSALDTGWVEVPEMGSSTSVPTKSIHATFDWSSVSAGSIRILSDQAVKDPEVWTSGTARIPVGAIENIPDTFVQAGFAVGSEKVELLTGIQAEGPQVNVEIEEVVGNTLGGQTYGADSFRRRVCEPTPIVVNRAEKDFLMSIAWERGRSGAFYVILETGVALERQVFTSFLTTMKVLSSPRQISTWHPGDEVKYNMTIAFEEKL